VPGAARAGICRVKTFADLAAERLLRAEVAPHSVRWSRGAHRAPAFGTERRGMKIRTLLVDDEEWAVSRLRQLCAEHPDITVIGEAQTGPEALEKLQTLAPRLLFLDINLGAMSGLDVLSALDPDDMPFVIFVTASDSYAATAFDLAAVDYLLEPCTPTRFAQAVGKIRQCVGLGLAAPGGEQLLAGWRKYPGTGGAAERRDGLFVEDGGRFVFLDTASIDFVEAARNYVVIHAAPAARSRRRD
jgi:two-component system, LytTR family, response regulator